MGTYRKTIILALILIFGTGASQGASKNAPPDDILTIEALIDAHKKMKKAEDLAIIELTTTAGTQEITKKAAAKYNETRKMLNQRLADVGSVVTIASSLVSLTQQLKNLTESYVEFTETTYKNAKRKPFLMLVYTNANMQIANEIKHITKCCTDYALFQTNVLKSTMDEKRQLLNFLSAHIASTQRIINRATLTCRSALTTGVQMYHVDQIINSETNKEIMNKIISKWKQNAVKDTEIKS